MNGLLFSYDLMMAFLPSIPFYLSRVPIIFIMSSLNLCYSPFTIYPSGGLPPYVFALELQGLSLVSSTKYLIKLFNWKDVLYAGTYVSMYVWGSVGEGVCGGGMLACV